MATQTFYCPELGRDVTICKLNKFALAHLATLSEKYRDADRRKLAQGAYILRYGVVSPALKSPLEASYFMRRIPPALTGRLIGMIIDLTAREVM